MRVTVTDLYRRSTETLEGDEDSIEGQLGMMFPELCAEVHPDDGLQALIEHLNERLQGFDIEIAPFGELQKMQTAPKLPKLDRRGGGDVDLVSTGQQLDTKLGLMFNAANMRSNMRGSTKRMNREDYIEGSARGARGRASTVSAPNGKIRIGYAAEGHLRSPNPGMTPGNMGGLATAQHELFHQTISRAVEEVPAAHRHYARSNLARNLFSAIPKIHQPDVLLLQRTIAPHYEESLDPHEERLARMMNYVNDPKERALFYSKANMNPERARMFDTSIKRALKAVRAAAAQAHEEWFHPLIDRMEKSEDLEKTVLDPSYGYKITRHSPTSEGWDQNHYGDLFYGMESFPEPEWVEYRAHDPSGALVGSATFSTAESPGNLYPVAVHVHPAHRRRGLASALYAHAEKDSGLPAVRAEHQTAEGQGLWAGNKQLKQFGKSERTRPRETASTEVVRDHPSEDDGSVIRDMLGFAPCMSDTFRAAKFLAGGKADPSDDYLRQSTYDADGDMEVAALTAYGLEPSEENITALRAVSKLLPLKKSEAPKLGEVLPMVPEAKEVAEAIAQAEKDGKVEPLQLNGKHSAGSLLVRTKDKSYLMKMGSGNQSPALGAREESASQSAREAAFWHVAAGWGLGDALPRCDWVSVSGKDFAAIELLPWEWKSAFKVDKADHARMHRILHVLRQDGTLHKWAILDYALGQPDRHAQNIMVGPDDEVKLIDQGSAFAGVDFDPAQDRNSFVPFYLRARTPQGKFNKMSAQEKFHALPTLSSEVADSVRAWLEALDADKARETMTRYGIDPAPSLARLDLIKSSTGPIDAVVNAAWTLDSIQLPDEAADDAQTHELPLEKMALADVPHGQEVPGYADNFDYSHVIPAPHRKSYGLTVTHQPPKWKGNRDRLVAHLRYKDPKDQRSITVGEVTGYLNADKSIEPHSTLWEQHRGKGLGVAMYEALLAHAKHSGVQSVKGGIHSLEASRVHQALAQKHGMNYHSRRTPEGLEETDLAPYSYGLK